jgi:hypothetical protein
MPNKIWNWLLGKEESEEKEKQPDNVVDSQKELLNAIIAYLKKHFFGQKTFTDTIVLWIDSSNPAYQSYVRDEEFEKRLRTELENKQLIAISKADFVFKTEKVQQDSKFPEIAQGVYIQLIAKKNETKPTVYTKAKITIANNKGSLMQYEYILDATNKNEFNIGRGEGNFNHIIIKENDPIHYETNIRVSRDHAKIVFIAEKGFYLQSRNETNRTIINRNEQRFADLKDLNAKSLLRDDDEIELGKSVCLRFQIFE